MPNRPTPATPVVAPGNSPVLGTELEIVHKTPPLAHPVGVARIESRPWPTLLARWLPGRDRAVAALLPTPVA